MKMRHKIRAGGRHRDRIERMRMHAALLLNRLEAHDVDGLPENVDVKKLEDAYEKMAHYHLVLKRVSGNGA